MTTPATPRLAATVLLVRDDPFEVLMVRRSSGGPFPDALVFPGGTVDADDGDEAWLPLVRGADALDAGDRALRIAAMRETFEEVGLFLGVDASGDPVTPVACDATDFRALVAASGAVLPLDALVPFARWITPERAPKRWDTHFFLARAPLGQTAICDEVETMAPDWLALETMRGAAHREMGGLLAPTLLNLSLLAESGHSDAALAAAQARTIVTVLPRVEMREGKHYIVIPAEGGYGISTYPAPSSIIPPAA